MNDLYVKKSSMLLPLLLLFSYLESLDIVCEQAAVFQFIVHIIWSCQPFTQYMSLQTRKFSLIK